MQDPLHTLMGLMSMHHKHVTFPPADVSMSGRRSAQGIREARPSILKLSSLASLTLVKCTTLSQLSAPDPFP